MRTGRPVVVSDPVPPQSVLDRALEVGAAALAHRQGLPLSPATSSSGAGPCTPRREGGGSAGLAYPALRGANQLVNASGRAGGDRSPARAPAGHGPGRAQRPGAWSSCRAGSRSCPGQPTLVLDVAHNPHSVAALAENLDAMGFYPGHPRGFRCHGRQGSGAPCSPASRRSSTSWYLTDLPLPRASSAQALATQIEALPKPLSGPGGRVAGLHASPMDALRAAVAAADPADRIVVFGSFYTVGGVLQDGVPRLSAKHLAP